MERMFIESRSEEEILLDNKIISKLPRKIAIITTVQFTDQIKDIVLQLEKYGKKVFISKRKQKYPGQVLGCDVSSAETIKDKVSAFLYIGTGQFHPLKVQMETGKEVLIFNPESKQLSKVDEKEIEKLKKRIKGNYLKFLNSTEIGILVSIKPGQYNLQGALKLKEKISKEGKNGYIILVDNVDLEELENFSFIECFVNTACPRIPDEKKGIINLEDINN